MTLNPLHLIGSLLHDVQHAARVPVQFIDQHLSPTPAPAPEGFSISGGYQRGHFDPEYSKTGNHWAPVSQWRPMYQPQNNLPGPISASLRHYNAGNIPLPELSSFLPSQPIQGTYAPFYTQVVLHNGNLAPLPRQGVQGTPPSPFPLWNQYPQLQGIPQIMSAYRGLQ